VRSLTTKERSVSWEKSDKLDEGNSRTVSLGGKDYVIAPFTLRRIKKVAGLTPRVMRLDAAQMSEEALDPFVDVLWQGLLGAYPKLDRDEVEDLAMTMAEINAAVDVIMEQMGGVKKPPPGEPQAASALKT
jgi:hypothetical protein